MRALIVGGGVAGPACAIALHAVGIESTVLEAAEADEARGSWLTVSVNGVAALDELGALDGLRPSAVPTRSNVMIGATGRELGRIGIGAPLADGTPSLSFRRPSLAAGLRREAEGRGIEVRRGTRVQEVRTTESSARVSLEDGSTLDADLVIGADGIRSVVRSAIDPDAPSGRYVGLINFGGITRSTPLARALEPEAWTMVFGERAFFGALPTPDGDVVWFVNEPRPETTREERATTSTDAWRAHLADLAASDAGPMAALIRGGELELAGDVTRDLARVRRWHRDRLVLVGDALHAPSPSSGQGASMALEDAIALASALSREGEPPRAFAAFEADRRSRVERIVRDGARSTSTKTARGASRAVRDAMLRVVFRRLVTDRSQAWKFDYRATLPATARRSS